ncbi:MAG TPA: thioredoxin family protein [Bacteroidota bacterium]
MRIEIIGMNCRSCNEAEQNVRKVVQKLEVEAEIITTADAAEMQLYRVSSLPAIVIDGVLKSFGRVPSERDVRDWLLPYVSSSFAFDV